MKFKELAEKAREINLKYVLSEKQREVLTKEQRRLTRDKYKDVPEFDAKLTRQNDNGIAFNNVATWFTAHEEGLPQHYGSMFDKLVTLQIFQRGCTKEENIERYEEIFEDFASKDAEVDKKFRAYAKDLLKKLEPQLDILAKIGCRSFELSLEAFNNLENYGIKHKNLKLRK